MAEAVPPGGRPRMLLVHHRAEATQEAIGFVELVRAIVVEDAFDVRVLLLAGGPLQGEIEDLAPTTVVTELDRRSREAVSERLLFALRLKGAGYDSRSRRLGLDGWGPGDVVYLHTLLAVQALRYLPSPGPRVLCRLAEDVYPLHHPLKAPDEKLLLARVDHFLPVTVEGEGILRDDHAVSPARVTRVPELFVPRDDRLPDRTPDIERLRDRLGIAPGAVVVASFGAYAADAPDLGVLLWAMLARRLGPDVPVEMLWWYQATGAGFWMEHDLLATGLAARTHAVPVADELGPYLELCDVLLLLTREADYPFAYLERAAQGVPVLCFDVNGLAGLARLGGEAHVAPYLDLAPLADEVARLIGDGALASDRLAMLDAVAQIHGPRTFGRRLIELASAPAVVP